MSLSTQVTALTTATESLLSAVNTRKTALDAAEASASADAAAALEARAALTSVLEGVVSVYSFMTDEQIDDVRAGTVTLDTTAAIQSALSFAATYGRKAVELPYGRYKTTGVALPSRVILRGSGELYPDGEGAVALKLENTLYSAVHDISIFLNAANQKAIQIISAGSGTYSQLNNFYNVKIDGTLPAGSVGIEINDAFTNSFFGVNVLRAATGVTFANGANANHFYGGELRCVNTNPNSNNPVVHGELCSSNGFHGTVIENWRLAIKMDGGVAMFDSGCYIEAFASAESFQVNGGDIRIIGNYLNNGFIFVYGGGSVSVNDNVFDGTLSNANYPFIQYRADVATRLNCKSNQVLNAAGSLVRPRDWRNSSSVWAARSLANRVEFIENKLARFQGRLVSDRTDVTGDNTSYTVDFGSNRQFDDGNNFSTNGIFTAPENGLYNLSTMLWLSGLVGGTHTDITVQIVTSNRVYELVNQGTDSLTVAGRIKVNGLAFVDMEAGDTATVLVKVAGSVKGVDILRGDATNGYTMFTGYKVA